MERAPSIGVVIRSVVIVVIAIVIVIVLIIKRDGGRGRRSSRDGAARTQYTGRG